MISFEHVSKQYTMGDNVVKALDDVTVQIGVLDFVAIVGPSGSGKSTMMNIIGCLDIADSGKYALDGLDISAYTEDQLADVRSKKIGFIFQQFNLLQKLTAQENVELPLVYQGISAGERRQRAAEALTRVGLADRAKHRPNELSGGQQQRVAIARALVSRPKLILADEPTGNLDSRSGHEIMTILHELHEQGNCIVLITHDNTIAQQTERLIRLADGRVIGDETGGKEVAI